MNQYGLPLQSSVTQTVLPAMTEDGKVHGWYPITQTEFTGTETEFTLPDCTVPLKTVTVDTVYELRQYMAAVWPVGLPFNSQPWASASLIEGGDQYYRWYSMPTQGTVLHFGYGVLLLGLTSNLNQGTYVAPTPTSPTVTNSTKTWYASLDYKMLTGNCTFFDFNWVTQFVGADDGYASVKSIAITELPAPALAGDPNPIIAKIIGVPVATVNGTIFDTVRVITNQFPLEKGSYTISFEVTDSNDAVHPVSLVITVA